jgi:histone-lysine N-methyltransferase SETMAR
MASNSHAGELPRRKHTTFRTRRKFKIKNKIIFHHESAPAHKSVLAMGKLRGLHYELLEHPPFSPDLAPSDFCLFPKLKLTGQHFSSNQEAIAAVEGYFADHTTGTG